MARSTAAADGPATRAGEGSISGRRGFAVGTRAGGALVGALVGAFEGIGVGAVVGVVVGVLTGLFKAGADGDGRSGRTRSWSGELTLALASVEPGKNIGRMRWAFLVVPPSEEEDGEYCKTGRKPDGRSAGEWSGLWT